MKAADRLECLPMQQAICVVTILKLQQILRDCEQEDRRRLLPYVYKILSHYNGKSIFFLILAANLKFFFQIFKVKVSVFKILSHFIGKWIFSHLSSWSELIFEKEAISQLVVNFEKFFIEIL